MPERGGAASSAARPTGANSIYLSPAGGHVLASSAIAPEKALEIVFHEASHTLMRDGDPVPEALGEAAARLGSELPRDLWHVVLLEVEDVHHRSHRQCFLANSVRTEVEVLPEGYIGAR